MHEIAEYGFDEAERQTPGTAESWDEAKVRIEGVLKSILLQVSTVVSVEGQSYEEQRRMFFVRFGFGSQSASFGYDADHQKLFGLPGGAGRGDAFPEDVCRHVRKSFPGKEEIIDEGTHVWRDVSEGDLERQVGTGS